MTLTPAANQVGWVVSTEATGNHIGDDDVYGGQLNGNVYLGVVQVDATGFAGRAAELVLTGQTTQFVAGGDFTAEVIRLGDAANASYVDIADATVVATLGTVSSGAVGVRTENRFQIAPSAMQLDGGRFTVRIRGSAGSSVMSWDSGHGTGGLLIPPRVVVAP